MCARAAGLGLGVELRVRLRLGLGVRIRVGVSYREERPGIEIEQLFRVTFRTYRQSRAHAAVPLSLYHSNPLSFGCPLTLLSLVLLVYVSLPVTVNRYIRISGVRINGVLLYVNFAKTRG